MTERILKLGTGTILNVQKKLAMINEAKPGLSEQLARPAGGGGISSGSFQAGGGRHYVRVQHGGGAGGEGGGVQGDGDAAHERHPVGG